MTFDEAAELGAKLTVAREARKLQAASCEGQLKALAFLLREEAEALKAFSVVADYEIRKDVLAEASRISGQAHVLEGLFPAKEEAPT